MRMRVLYRTYISGHMVNNYVWSIVIIFFKQRTAYEWRFRDWSSDVCSSDLVGKGGVYSPRAQAGSEAPISSMPSSLSITWTCPPPSATRQWTSQAAAARGAI